MNHNNRNGPLKTIQYHHVLYAVSKRRQADRHMNEMLGRVGVNVGGLIGRKVLLDCKGGAS